MCKKADFLENMKQKKGFKELLMTHALDKKLLTDDCIKKITKIDMISVVKFADIEKQKTLYCNADDAAKIFKNCELAPPNQQNTTKSPIVTTVTTESNKTGNATTSGEAKSINALVDMLYLTLTVFISMLL